MHVCAQKKEIDSPFHENFYFGPFIDLNFVVIFCSSEFMCRVLFFIWAL